MMPRSPGGSLYDLNHETDSDSEMAVSFGASILRDISQSPVQGPSPRPATPILPAVVASPGSYFCTISPVPPPVEPVVTPAQGIFQRMYSWVNGILTTVIDKKAPVVIVTNKPENLPGPGSMFLHNARVLAKETGGFAQAAGQMTSPVSPFVYGGPPPFHTTATFNASCQDFVFHQAPMPIKEVGPTIMPEPLKTVTGVLLDSYAHLVGSRFTMFNPIPYSQLIPLMRPDLLFRVWWHLSNVLGTGTKVKPLFMMNMLYLDPRDYWQTYRVDTGLPFTVVIPGDWWFRVKVSRGRKYVCHIVLRGTISFKAAGFRSIVVSEGETCIHPIKLFVRLVPHYQRHTADVLTIVV